MERALIAYLLTDEAFAAMTHRPGRLGAAPAIPPLVLLRWRFPRCGQAGRCLRSPGCWSARKCRATGRWISSCR
ncbi:hypothetical protein ACTMU2_23025 [Cupriavidus basilensis]